MRVDTSLPKINENPALSSTTNQPDAQAPKVPASDSQTEPVPNLHNEKQQLQVAVKQANKALEGVQRHFKYEMHKATKQVVISVIDDKTGEVIGEIPPKKLLDAVAKLWELAGLFVDERR